MSDERSRPWLAPRRLDPVLAVTFTGIMLVQLVAGTSTSPWAPLLVVLAGAPIVVLRTHPVPAALAEAALVLATPDLGSTFPPNTIALVIFALSYACGAHARRRPGLAAVVALVCAMQVHMGFADFPNVEILFMTMPAWWVGRQVRARSAVVAALAARTRELAAEQDAFVQLSVRRERARIAHELHDIVAHHLAVIAIQAGAGRLAAPGPEEPARERLRSIREAAVQALGEMSRLVDVLHADADLPDGDAGLRRLLERARVTGVRVDAAALPTLPPELERSAASVVQEGLTNAMKHAPGSDVTVRLTPVADGLEVEVHNGPGTMRPSLADTGSGMGLAGMRARVDAAGGSLQAGPAGDGGWRLLARLPAAATALSPGR